MQYCISNKPKRKRRQTLVNEIPIDSTTKWWGVSVPRGIAIIMKRIADEVEAGCVSSLSFKWDGSDEVIFSVDNEQCSIQLDARIYGVKNDE